MKTNKLYKLIVPLLFLAGSIGVAWGQGTEPVKEDKYLKLDLPYSNIIFINPGDNIEEKFDGNNISGLYDHSTSTWYKYNNGVLPEITFTFQKKETVSAIAIQSGVSENAQPKKVKIQWSDNGNSWDEGEEYTINPITPTNGENPIYSISLKELRETQYLKLTLSPQLGTDKWVTVQDIWIYVLPTIQHKYAKWHDQRGSAEYDDDFDDTEWFDTSADWRPEEVHSRNIQATHTYIDTIYAHRGSTVELTLPDHLNNDISIQSYQRWYSFRTGRTFATQYNNDESGNEEERIVDLLTPTVENFYYRLANGYVGSPISEWAQVGNSGDICSMNFYFPTEEQFKQMFPNADKTIDNNWYVVACDVSGYTDYTETFDKEDSKNATFGAKGKYYEPTLSHRIVFYIHAVEDEDSWYNKAWKNKESYLEEYEINMPFTRYVDKTFEVVALSKDARSYVNPSSIDDGKLTVTINDNDAGIELKELTGNTNEGHMKQEDGQWVISGENRVISFDYPTDKGNGTKQVNDKDGDGHSSATIIVRKGEKNIARFKLNFIKGTSLMTQSMIKALNDQRDGITGGTKVDEDWDYPERTPQYMEENKDSYEFLTGLDFNFTQTTDWANENYYPFPLAWDHCSYAFFDGSTDDYFKGGSTYPEWGYYSIMSNYLECAGGGWNQNNKKPDKKCMEPRNDNEKDIYHMFIDASDRPGIIARLPFKKDELCDGTELIVSAWVKSAKWDKTVHNAAMLFTFMGVTEEGEYVPLYRHQTGQIPSTYMCDNLKGKLPGFDGTSNEWFQIYFSFVTNPDLLQKYDDIVLQIENNSASTSGGDMYIDDIRLYMHTLKIEGETVEPVCSSDEVAKVKLRLDYNKLLSKLGEKEANTEETPIIRTGYYSFLNKTVYDREYQGNPENYASAFSNALVQGDNVYDDSHSNYGTFTFSTSASANNGQNGMPNIETDDAGVKWLTFTSNIKANDAEEGNTQSSLMPGESYYIVYKTMDMNGENPSESDLSTFYEFNTRCAIKGEFTVTGALIIRINGQVTTEAPVPCIGQIPFIDVTMKDDEGKEVKDAVFDWYFGTLAEFNKEQQGENRRTLYEILESFRFKYPDATEINDDIQPFNNGDAYFLSQDDIDFLKELNTTKVEEAQNPKLTLSASKNLSIKLFKEETHITLIPTGLLEDAEDDDILEKICWEPTELLLYAQGAAPTLNIGLLDIDYPYASYAQGDGVSIRTDLKRIHDIQENDGALIVPVRDPKLEEKPTTLVPVTEDLILYLAGTTDPQYQDKVGTGFDYEVGTVNNFEISGSTGKNEQPVVEFYLCEETGTGVEQKGLNMREGYRYDVTFRFKSQSMPDPIEEGNECYGNVIVPILIVPEYQVWEGNVNDNWNNDNKWRRADKDELNKGNSYTTNETNGTSNGYVPIASTHVVIQNGENNQIMLYRPEPKANDIKVLDLTTGKNSLDINDASNLIEYDLVVEMSPINENTAHNYKVTTYYTNTAAQIHFEPSAEMLHAELLDYNKAWVDYKLKSGLWHTLASPLQGVVAGDFYTDSETGSDANNVAGTENQEYFTDITFDGKVNNQESKANNATLKNSRFSPSVYQRGWGKDAEMVTVGNTDGNSVAVQGNWSAVYNDVKEAYTPGTGFSLKVLDMPDSKTEAIFRLPKADGSYFYYDATTGNASGDAVSINRNGEDNTDTFVSGQLITNSLKPEGTESSTKEIKVTLTQNGTNSYYLVGNPFMANLNMKQFFTTNMNLEKKYWIVTENNQEVAVGDANGLISTGTGIIAPLQSFFVQKATGATSNEVKFTAEMQTLESSTDGTSGNALYLTATTADGKKSRAAIAYDATAAATYAADEDAELFLDSNLSDVPAIYTVAGTMATSINRTSELYNIPVGIYGNSTELVTLSFEGLNHFSSATLYDAEKKTETPLHEETTLTVPASTSGRYFLRAGTPTANEVIETSDIQIYTLSSNRVMVTSNVPLKDIRVYTMNGAQVKHTKAGVCSFELYLPDGIYLITAQNTSGETQTEKIVVR